MDCPLGDVYGEEEIKVLARVVQKMLSQGQSSGEVFVVVEMADEIKMCVLIACLYVDNE